MVAADVGLEFVWPAPLLSSPPGRLAPSVYEEMDTAVLRSDSPRSGECVRLPTNTVEVGSGIFGMDMMLFSVLESMWR